MPKCQLGMQKNVQGHRIASVCKQTYDASCRCLDYRNIIIVSKEHAIKRHDTAMDFAGAQQQQCAMAASIVNEVQLTLHSLSMLRGLDNESTFCQRPNRCCGTGCVVVARSLARARRDLASPDPYPVAVRLSLLQRVPCLLSAIAAIERDSL